MHSLKVSLFPTFFKHVIYFQCVVFVLVFHYYLLPVKKKQLESEIDSFIYHTFPISFIMSSFFLYYIIYYYKTINSLGVNLIFTHSFSLLVFALLSVFPLSFNISSFFQYFIIFYFKTKK